MGRKSSTKVIEKESPETQEENLKRNLRTSKEVTVLQMKEKSTVKGCLVGTLEDGSEISFR